MTPRETSTQWCVLLVLQVLISLVLLGCGRIGPEAVQQGDEAIKRVREIPPHPPIKTEPFEIANQNIPRQRTESLEEIMKDLAMAAKQRTQQRARETLEELYGGDVYDQALAQALCSGMAQLSEHSDENVRYTQEAWEGYLKVAGTEYAKDIAREYGYQYIDRTAMINKVDGLLTAWNIGEDTSPQTARIYVKACVMR